MPYDDVRLYLTIFHILTTYLLKYKNYNYIFTIIFTIILPFLSQYWQSEIKLKLNLIL